MIDAGDTVTYTPADGAPTAARVSVVWADGSDTPALDLELADGLAHSVRHVTEAAGAPFWS